MRVALVNFAQPPGTRSVASVLEAAFSLVDWAEALSDAGAEVAAVQGFTDDAVVERRGVRYHLVAGPFVPMLHPRRLVRRVQRRIAELRPQVVHVGSLLYARQAHDLRRRLPRARIVLQHHAERPPGDPLRRALARRWLGAADAFVFTGLAAATPWQRAGLLPAAAELAAIAEGSSRFRPAADRHAARRRLGIDGDPLILSLGRLDDNKDPLTLLRGLEPVLAARPRARAIFCFQDAPLQHRVESLVAARPALARAVELRGRIAYDALEPLVQAADVLVQGSHREGSSYALLDALACGVVPVVSDIPSHAFLTDQGRLGELWPPGDADALTGALDRALDPARGPGLAARQRAAAEHFARRLAYPALARAMLDVYRGG